jgi:hypothetical protein
MRYAARANNDSEGWDIIDTQDWTSDVEDEREHPVILTVWDVGLVETVLLLLNNFLKTS